MSCQWSQFLSVWVHGLYKARWQLFITFNVGFSSSYMCWVWTVHLFIIENCVSDLFDSHKYSHLQSGCGVETALTWFSFILKRIQIWTFFFLPRCESSRSTLHLTFAARWSRDGSMNCESWRRSWGRPGSNSRGRNSRHCRGYTKRASSLLVRVTGVQKKM